MPYEGVSTLFQNLVMNTQLTPEQYDDASGKHHRVRAVLNQAYYGITNNTANSFVVGSYGKNTEIKPPSDIDILFCLPPSVYERFSKRSGNIQSQLLQEVKEVLQANWKSTSMKADGQIIFVPFVTYAIEVLPTFLLQSTQYWHADANNGGQWRTTDPKAEKERITTSNIATKGKTIHLIKLAKAWKESRTVKIKSLVLELLATNFLTQWQHTNTTGYVYYDFMIRDFLNYLLGYKNSYVTIPGTGDVVFTGDLWVAQATFAYNAAIRAADYGAEDKLSSAKTEWGSIFGNYLV